MTPEPNPEHNAAVKIADDHVTLPPRASLMISVNCEDAFPDVDAIVESDQRLLLGSGISVTRGITRFRQRQSHVLVTSFSDEYQHLNKGAAIAFLEQTQEAGDVIAVAAFERAPEDTVKLPNPFDVNGVTASRTEQILALLRHYRGCFSSNSNYVTHI